LNIGPAADGSIPEESVRILTAVGEFAKFTRKGNTLYTLAHFWPGSTVALGGLTNQVKSARLLVSGQEIKFDQDKFRLRMTGLPEKAPDEPVKAIAIDCDGGQHQDMRMIRAGRPRRGVGISG
jgi:alpha-L-fucosidase